MDLSLADRLKELKTQKDEVEEELKSIKSEIENVEYALLQEMVEEEVQSFSKDGTMYYLSTRIFASPVSDKKEELYRELRDRGYGDIISETVNSNTLSAFVKEQIEANGGDIPDWMADVVNVFEKTSVAMRKSSK